MRITIILILVQWVLFTNAQKGLDTYSYQKTGLTGAWKSIGDGYLLQMDEKEIQLYSYTTKFCYKEKNDYLIGLLNSSSKFEFNRTQDTISVYLQDFGDQTKTLQSGKKFCRLNTLPENCKILTEIERKDPVFLFELMCSTLKENYAFAQERNLDWDQIYYEFKPKISTQTSQEELFNIFGEIVTRTKDQHTKIISPEGKTKQYSGIPTALLLREVFDQQSSAKDFNEYISQFFKINYDHISNDLLQGKGKKVANGKLEWGDLTSDIGYIHIHALTGFASNSLPRKQHLDTLNYYMTQIMGAFQGKKAIVIDVSFNFGGYDAAGLTIAGYFTDKSIPAYTKYIFQNGNFYKETEFKITPSTKHPFTKPVFILTTDITRSAAESFVLQMKALSHVIAVGTNTLGIFSDMLGKSIGEYYLTLSNEKYQTPKGEMYEVKGVDVDIKMNVFPKDNIFNGHRDAVKQLINIIEKK